MKNVIHSLLSQKIFVNCCSELNGVQVEMQNLLETYFLNKSLLLYPYQNEPAKSKLS